MLNNQMGRFLNQFIGCTKNHVSPLGATAILATFIATFLIYFPGLAGPLVLDDNINLRDITHYLEGNKTALAVITDNQSGRLGRPVSMASFVLDAYLWGDSTWHAKRSS